MTVNPTPRVDARHGAPMGRHAHANPKLDPSAGPLYLRRIAINKGGYDAGGAYWGLGPPLYYVEDQRGNGHFFRAAFRSSAKLSLLQEWPDATFYR